MKNILEKKYTMPFLQMEDTYNIFDVKNKEGVNPAGPEIKSTLKNWKEIWNSDLLERIRTWDEDLIVKK